MLRRSFVRLYLSSFCQTGIPRFCFQFVFHLFSVFLLRFQARVMEFIVAFYSDAILTGTFHGWMLVLGCGIRRRV
jgi:hypothetical protein